MIVLVLAVAFLEVLPPLVAHRVLLVGRAGGVDEGLYCRVHGHWFQEKPKIGKF